MSRMLLASVVAVVAVAGAPVQAHHSANAQFDVSKEVTITGVLTKLDNVNPHSWWFVTVKESNGKETKWRLESLSPSGLIRQGLKVKTDLKMGGTYSFTVAPAWKDPAGEKMGFMKSLTVNDKVYNVVEL